MNKPITFAIVVPVYNVEKYLRECLESIRNQTYPHFEVFMVDDGSTDSSGKICDEYSLKDDRFHALHKRNGGIASVRNFALDKLLLKRERFRYICSVDGDDVLSTSFLSTLVPYFIENSWDCIFVNFQYFQNLIQKEFTQTTFDFENQEVRQYFFGKIKNKPQIAYPSVCTKIIKASLMQQYRFDEELRIAEDLDFTLKILEKIKRLLVIDDGLYYYRVRENSLTTTRNSRQACSKEFFSLDSVYQKYLSTGKREYIRYLWKCRFDAMYRDIQENPRLGKGIYQGLIAKTYWSKGMHLTSRTFRKFFKILYRVYWKI